ncbi:nitric oxide dioxygenase [Rhizobium sp. RU35A]|uniref:globin family protein n=1 Tax=Rhizobium sp. RU35A TaxID=1907414 RepID=UPI00095549A2|nr:globin family protein [Rhizobium sp. RU35A]SIQ37823.1 nitric oxide dioxygenase [Rhizobium sp. RU35A]
MTPNEIDLVQSSFAKVVPIREAAADLFYGRLFDIAPEVKPLFKGDMQEQGRKLMMTLGIVVNGLKDIAGILPAAEALAVRHNDYGVKPEYYAPVGEALIWTLEQGLGPDFTPAVRDAWITAYTTLSQVMISASCRQPVGAE